MERFIGLMSGTSADGVDAVVARFEKGRFQSVEASCHLPHPDHLRAALIALGRNASASIALSELARLDVEIANQFAEAANRVLSAGDLNAAQIRAIGSHGQTIFHDPKGIQSSWQIGDPNRIAALTGIPVVADFRRMDVAWGGEGAPLVPAFHQAVFRAVEPTAVVNLGGIANLTLISNDPSQATTGYDCGPANALMDEWALRQLGTRQDAEGRFAAQGTVIVPLLASWLRENYFHQAPPKSTGRSLFNLEWAARLAPRSLESYEPADVQATLSELTVRTVAAAIPGGTARVLVCGGGAFNTHLMQSLARALPTAQLRSTDCAGLPPQWVEAAAFAWLAHQRVYDLPGNLPSVTGASKPAVLGGIYG